MGREKYKGVMKDEFTKKNRGKKLIKGKQIGKQYMLKQHEITIQNRKANEHAKHASNKAATMVIHDGE